MSTQFSTSNDYLKLIATYENDFTRPASTAETNYGIGIDLSDDPTYTPLVFGTYTDANGRTFPCKGFTFFPTFPAPFSPVTVELSTRLGGVDVRVVGDAADATPHTVRVNLYIFANSLADL